MRSSQSGSEILDPISLNGTILHFVENELLLYEDAIMCKRGDYANGVSNPFEQVHQMKRWNCDRVLDVRTFDRRYACEREALCLALTTMGGFVKRQAGRRGSAFSAGMLLQLIRPFSSPELLKFRLLRPIMTRKAAFLN